jgi:hypothetical protein
MAVSMPLAVGGLALLPEGSRSSSPSKALRNAFLDGLGSGYPWMNALEAQAALAKAVSGYKHEASH